MGGGAVLFCIHCLVQLVSVGVFIFHVKVAKTALLEASTSLH